MVPIPGEEQQRDHQRDRDERDTTPRRARVPENEREHERNRRPVVRLDEEQHRDDRHGGQIASRPARAEEHVDAQEVQRRDEPGEVDGGEIAHDQPLRAEQRARRGPAERPAPPRGDREHEPDDDRAERDRDQPAGQQARTEEHLGEAVKVKGERHPLAAHLVLVEAQLSPDDEISQREVLRLVVVIHEHPRVEQREGQVRERQAGEQGSPLGPNLGEPTAHRAQTSTGVSFPGRPAGRAEVWGDAASEARRLCRGGHARRRHRVRRMGTQRGRSVRVVLGERPVVPAEGRAVVAPPPPLRR